MTGPEESLVEFAAPRLTDESSAAIRQEIQAAFSQGVGQFVEALDTTAEEIVDLLPDDLDFTQSEEDYWKGKPDQVTEISVGIAEQIGGVAFSGLAVRISRGYYKRQTEGVKKA